jgi:O-antigen/teichoic acid export membrane protein
MLLDVALPYNPLILLIPGMKTIVGRLIKLPSFDKRTIQNILSIAVLRGGNIGLQLILVPISIKFVSSSAYGLWLTLSSMITWLNIMDIGLSNGLRNKLTEAITRGDDSLGKTYVSTTYCLLALLSVIGFVLGLFLVYGLDWRHIIDIPAGMSGKDFRQLLLIIVSSFFLTFLLKPIASVAYATHKAYVEYLILFIANLANFLLIWGLLKITPSGNIVLMALCFCFTPILVTAILSIYLFRTHFRQFAPSVAKIDFNHARELMSLSGQFFIIQIAATIVFTTNNFIISHYFGNEDVTRFNIVQRYFNVVIILQGMILVPFWAIFTEAFARRDVGVLEGNMKKLLNLTALLVAGCLVMAVLSRFAYGIWIGDLVKIPLSLTLVTCLYTILLLYSSVYTIFINGTGRVRLQMITAVFSSTFHIPLAILMIKYFHIGMEGILLVSCFWLVITLPLRHIQYKKLVFFKEGRSLWTR